MLHERTVPLHWQFRSQPNGEAWATHLSNGRFVFASAGTFPSSEVHPLAVRTMAEVGIDISHAKPKTFTQVPKPIHVIIAVCGQSATECPTWPGLEVEAWDIVDSVKATGTEEQMLVYRAVRDQLKELVADFLSRTVSDRPK